MTTKLKAHLTRSTKQSVFIKVLSKEGKPIGLEQEIPIEDWEDAEKEFLGDSLWEISLDADTERYVEAQQKRVDWLMEPSRLVYILRVKPPETSREAFILGSILLTIRVYFKPLWQI